MDPLIPVLLAPLGLYVLHHLLVNVRYRRSTYFRITKKRFSQLDAGAHGEYLIFTRLRDYEKSGGRFLFNLYLPTPNGGVTEVDVVLIHPRGIFVFESKNFSGWVFGNEQHEYWTQTLPSGRGFGSHKERFFNPIRQNASHVSHLKRLCSLSGQVWSIVVFSDSCELKDVTLTDGTFHRVLQLADLKATVGGIMMNASAETLSSDQVKAVFDKLYQYSKVSAQAKQSHAMAVREIKSREKKANLSAGS